MTENSIVLPDREPLPWAIDVAQEFCRAHVDARHYERAWQALATVLQVLDDSRLYVPKGTGDVPIWWRGSVTDLVTDLGATLTDEQVRDLAGALALRIDGQK